LAFFIVMALASGSESGSDDSGSWRALDKGNNQEPTAGRESHHKITLFTHRVIWIWQKDREAVAERCDCLVEGYTVLTEIRRSLVCIPFELIRHWANVGV